MANASNAFAWTSSWPLFYHLVHQEAIENVLNNLVDSESLETLKKQQVEADKHQNPNEADQHSMTGVVKGETRSLQVLRKEYISNTEKLISRMLADAIAKKKAGNLKEAFLSLGTAIHALQDASSPAHEGFQPWRFDETWSTQLSHLEKEGAYPDDQDIRRACLEGSVRYAYDIYMGKIPMPVQFFDPESGFLRFPVICQKK